MAEKNSREELSPEQLSKRLDRMEDGTTIQFLFGTGIGIVAIGFAFSGGVGRWIPVALGGLVLFVAVCRAASWKRGSR